MSARWPPNIYPSCKFAIGDCAYSGYPPTAQVAYQQGIYLAKQFNNRFENSKEFHFQDKGQIAYIGNSKSIYQNNKIILKKGTELQLLSKNMYVFISQKTFSPKATISSTNCLNTFSIGSIIKYFKVKQGKYIRRSSKGVRVFLNFLKNIFEKKYNNQTLLKGQIKGVA